MDRFMDMIPPEQIGIIVVAFLGLVGSIIAAIGYFVRWSVNHYTKVQDMKLDAMRQSLEKEKNDFVARNRRQEMEIQAKLDETLSTRENTRLLFSELAEERRDNAAQREAFERQREQQITIQKEQLEVYKGIEVNTAGTLELLKLHRDNVEILGIRQERIIRQAEDTHAKVDTVVTTLTTGLEQIKVKLDHILLEAKKNPNKDALERIEREVAHLIILAKPISEAASRNEITRELPELDDTKELPPTETNEKKEDAA